MTCEIIAVGTELLLGQIANTDAQYISRRLNEYGISVLYHTAVGDNPDRIKEAISIASQRCNIVILSGGLGPTVDDITKEILCEFLSLPLVLHQPSYEHLKAYFDSTHRAMTENNVKQVCFPEAATILPNDCGTAPGMLIETEHNTFAALPGPPKELEMMFDKYLLPLLAAKGKHVIQSRVLRMTGIGESAMENKVRDILDAQTNPTVAPLLGVGDVTLRITASADTEQEAAALIAPMEEKLRERLSDYIYGVDNDTPESVLVQLLQEKHLKIATAESCTGGMISSRITNVPGASEIFERGFVTYSNSAKVSLLGVEPDILQQYGAVSEQTARQMAEGVLSRTGADVAIGVTGIAGPGGGSPEKPIGLVYIAVATRKKCVVSKHNFTGSRDKVRFSASTAALISALRLIQSEYNS